LEDETLRTLIDREVQPGPDSSPDLAILESIQRRILWLSTAMIHHANFRRPNPDGTKVGGHESSSASVVSIFTALYFRYLRAEDRHAIKPTASPVYHSIQYLLGNLPREYLTKLRVFHGLQSYPSRTKDPDVDHFSTGSMGIGSVAPAFAALVQRYAACHFDGIQPRRFVATLGDAELDEGSVWEAVAEDYLRGLGNVLWIVDVNRQSLDRVVPGQRINQYKGMFEANGWHVMEVKYGRRLQAAFARPGGDALRHLLEDMSNEEYHALIRAPGAEVRERLVADSPALAPAIANIPDRDLPGLLADLGGHDLAVLLDAFAAADAHTTSAKVLFAHTLKGWGLPFAGDPLNHSALCSEEQLEELRQTLDVPDDDWATFAPNSPEGRLCRIAAERLRDEPSGQETVPPPASIPPSLHSRAPAQSSTQEAFGRILLELRRLPLVGERIVTVSPDVSVSTNLGAWINRVGVFHPEPGPSFDSSDASASSLLRWRLSPTGQHIELGIAEMNFYLLLGQFGHAAEIVGQHFFPIGTVYDPFVIRGLDALVYALYGASKMIFAGTPSGVSLSPEGGAHQSVVTPSLGIELPNLLSYEPAFAREVEWILLEALRQCCDREHGRSTYLRLSTKPIDQKLMEPALARLGEETLRTQVLAGGYRLVDRREAAPDLPASSAVQIAVSGAMVPEAVAAAQVLHAEGIAANVLHLTSADRLYRQFQDERRRAMRDPSILVDGSLTGGHLGELILEDERQAPIVTILDGASHTLAFLGSVFGAPVVPLGVDEFGQSGSRADVYATTGIDADHIVAASLLAMEMNQAGG
jgi:pyruvate dehydrogenase E1 component